MTLPTVLGASGIDGISIDYILIGGDKSPGKATVRGAAIERGWEIRKAQGLSGATVVPTGDELAKFSVLFEFWEDEQIDQWLAYAKKYFSSAVRIERGSAKPKALSIGHPLLILPPLNIIAAVVQGVSQLEMDGTGGWSTEVRFLEYRMPQRAPDKPDASIPAAQKPTPTAEDAADREIADKFAYLKNNFFNDEAARIANRGR